MNEVLKVLESRRSCRNFKPDMVKQEELKAIIKAGTYAATGMENRVRSLLRSPIRNCVTLFQRRTERSADGRKGSTRSTERRSYLWYWPTKTFRHIFMTAPS